MNYWQRWIGAWKKKTAALTLTERGAYSEMLDAYYANEGPLPANDEALFRIVGAMTRAEQDAVRAVRSNAEFFTEREGKLYNARADEELQRWDRFCELQRQRRSGHAPAEGAAHKGNGSKPIIDDTGDVIERIPMIGGVEFEVRESFAKELERLYPAVDIPATLKQMRGWCIGNPKRLKTPRGIRKFITGWCERDQNG